MSFALSHSLRKITFLSCVLVILAIAGCSSAPQEKSSTATQNTGISAVPQKIDRVAELLQKAENSAAPSSYSWLLQAADEYLRFGQPYKAFVIAKKIAPYLRSNIDKTQANLVMAEVLVQNDQFQDAYQLLPELSLQLGFDQRVFRLQSTLYQWSGEQLLAASALSAEIELSNSTVEKSEKTQQLWSNLISLKNDELVSDRKLRNQFKGWISLTRTVKENAFNKTSLRQSVANWQLNHPNHPASDQLPLALQELLELTPQTLEYISVILPLSGPQQLLGEAVKHGILFDYWQQKVDYKITFIDSNKSTDIIADMVSQQQPDLVIGPITKSDLLRLQPVLASYPLLALNSLTEPSNNPQHYFFSFDSSLEAVQAAEKIAIENHHKPIVIAQNTRNTKQTAETFAKIWQSNHGYSPEVIFFDDKDNIQNTVKDILDVQRSADRDIAANRTYKKAVKSDLRSRRDIDAIYLVADVTQTRLLKPFIDVNVSPFLDAIPVYATSRSYSRRADSTILRDLNSMKFTDMPWLIDGNRFANTKSHFDRLWPDLSDNESRLFAIGYDAMELASKLEQFSYLPNTFYQGKSGSIYLDENNQLVSIRKWAEYQDNKVVAIGMD